MSKVCLRALALVAVSMFAGVAMAGVITVTAATTTTTLYVAAATGSNTSNNCQSATTPCQTIQYAVDQAELDTGAVTIMIASGTYPEQVTVAPQSGSPMTSLTLQGTTSGTPTVVDPSSIVANVHEGSTSYGFDVNSGNVSAIIGVQTGSVDTAVSNTTIAATPASVTVEDLTVDGSNLPNVAPSIPWAGIALIDTSGSVQHNVVQNIQIPAAMGDSSVVGVAVKSTVRAQSVAVTNNVLKSHAGFVDVNLIAGAPGTLSAMVAGNAISGDPTSSTAQFGITAGGLTALTISGNTISDFQSKYDVGAIWLEPQATGATCAVTNNTLAANDDGVDVRGAANCAISGNTITAGFAGIEVGSGYLSGTLSRGTAISRNTISGTPTEATTTWYTGAAAVAGVPVDGVLVWDGTGTSVTGNAISGFASDVYVGEDPVYLNNTATWGSTTVPTSTVFPTTVQYNDLGHLATPASGSSVVSDGAACLNSNGQCTATKLTATDNWWQSASGPTSTSNPGGTGVPVSANVTFNPWLATVSMTPAAQGATLGSTATVRATLRDNTGATVSAAPLDSLFSTSPNVGAQTTALSSGSAPFSLSDSSAQTVTVHAAIGFGAQPSASTLAGSATVTFFNGSAYTALTPTRILDTRTDGKTLGPASSLNLTVTGGSVPSTATAVALNVTVTNTTAASFLTVYPTGGSNPVASSLNWTAGETIPNLVIVPVGTNGQVSFYNHSGSVDVIVDLEGYFGATNGTLAGSYVALTPARIADTRPSSGQPYAGHTLSGGSKLNIQVAGKGGIPATGASAALVNVTVTNTTAASFLTAYPAGASQPLASNLNWVAGETIANRVVVPIGSNGQITVFNHSGSVDVVVDVDGYFTASGFAPSAATLFSPMTPVRVLDTRANGETLGAGATLTLQLGGVAGIPSNASAVVTNVTATDTTASSYFTVYPGGTRPLASDLNWVAGETIPNLTVATLSSSGATTIYNHSGSADVIVDTSGYFSQG